MRWQHYRYIIAAALMAALIVSQVVLPLAGRADLYPFTIWRMFAASLANATDYGVLITAVDGRELAQAREPRDLRAQLGWPNIHLAYSQVQALAAAVEKKDQASVRDLRANIERNLFGRVDSATYEIHRRRYRPSQIYLGQADPVHEFLVRFRAGGKP